MASELQSIEVEPGSELDRLLDSAAEEPLWLIRNGARYRLERVRDDIWEGYDPDRARAGMRAAAGTWPGLDAESPKAYVYRGREAGTRQLDRPQSI